MGLVYILLEDIVIPWLHQDKSPVKQATVQKEGGI